MQSIEVTEPESKKNTPTNRESKQKRVFSSDKLSPYKMIEWSRRYVKISGLDGRIVFEADNVNAPSDWSQLAVDIAVSKYFKKAGVNTPEGHENSVQQLIERVVNAIASAGIRLKKYFATPEEAQIFKDELTIILLKQMAAFNSPVWFNCGLFESYGIKDSSENFYWDFKTEKPKAVTSAFENPQASACFIQSIDDNLSDIFNLALKEAKIFKYGSGSGTNFSKIRGKNEPLSGGGSSSGLMSFLEILDRGAGAIKSGGTTRRAAKMVCLDLDHPDIKEFINWKVNEELKVEALVQCGYDSNYEGEAYKTVSGQNSNNSVRIPDNFMNVLKRKGKWQTIARTSGNPVDTFPAQELWDDICHATWKCADPGVQFHDTIQKWHTCSTSGPINGSNPCSEFMFLDDTACNLASINLLKFCDESGNFDLDGFEHTIEVLLTAQDILVDYSSYPTEKITKNSHDFRPLGLGYANLGTLLMVNGIPYDSAKGRAWAASITALLTGHAYQVSAELAEKKGSFNGYPKNAESMMKVIGLHAEKLDEIDVHLAPENILKRARNSWAQASTKGKKYGFRNSQVTVLAPTGTIGLFMDCDTTGIEPDYSLVKFKKLAGGGYIKIVNQSVPIALKKLGYSKKHIHDILNYIVGTKSLENSPHINFNTLKQKGFSDTEIEKIEKSLEGAFTLESTITPWVLGEEAIQRLNLDPQKGSLLKQLGFAEGEIKEANLHVCGHQTIEGAPHLDPLHLPVFDCANKCGELGKRFLSPMAHIDMMAVTQPFLSGAISKTVNLPNEATEKDIDHIYTKAWEKGLKAVAVYRDGSKMSQPLAGAKTNKNKNFYSKLEVEDLLKSHQNSSTPQRNRLPQKRIGQTIEATVAGQKIFLRTGEYDDGSLGEVFIDMHKEGATMRSILNCFAIAISTGLQYGVPLEDFVNKFTFTRFEPSGMVDHPNVKTATSIVDYIFRVLSLEYLGRTDLVHVKPESIRQQNASPGFSQKKMTEKQNSGATNLHLSQLMGDAPMCDNCGHITVRNGSCYRCLNCGSSMGCS